MTRPYPILRRRGRTESWRSSWIAGNGFASDVRRRARLLAWPPAENRLARWREIIHSARVPPREAPMGRLTLATLNSMAQADFTRALGAVFEHSPWVAERAWPARPF